MKAIKSEQFIVDHRGKTVGVVLDLERYRQMVEDYNDLRIVAERRKNPKLGYEELRGKIRRRGRV